MAMRVKNLSAIQKTQIWSLGQEDLLKKGMATHSSIPVWKIPWTEEPHGLWFMGSQRVDTTEHAHPCNNPNAKYQARRGLSYSLELAEIIQTSQSGSFPCTTLSFPGEPQSCLLLTDPVVFFHMVLHGRSCLSCLGPVNIINYIFMNPFSDSLCDFTSAVCKFTSVVSHSLWPYVLNPTRLPCPWDFPGKNTGVGCHLLLQGIFPTH